MDTRHCGLFDSVLVNTEYSCEIHGIHIGHTCLPLNGIERMCCEFGSQMSFPCVKLNLTCERLRYDIAAPKILTNHVIYSTLCSLFIQSIDV